MTKPWSDRVSHDAAAALQLRTDVLVIGGSLAGAWAALSARQRGAQVVVVDKGFVGTAGAAAPANVGGYYANPDDATQSTKAIHARHAQAAGMDDLTHVARVYTQSFKAYNALEALGFQFHSRPNGLAQKGRFIGGYTLHFLRKALLRAGVRVLDHCPALELLRDAHGHIAGAQGWARQQHQSWQVQAGAVVLATGGGSFLSGAMGTRGLTFDGHLMAMEAQAELVNMEFSALYGYAPLGCPSTKGFMYEFASFYDGQRRPLEHGPGRQAMDVVARALVETGGAYAILDRVPDGFEASARLNHAVSFLYFDRLGIDPFRQLWPLQLLLEGHTRGVGGIRVAADGSTGVPGLYAAGDLTDRVPLTGAGMSGGGPAVAWCFASGQWAGEAAADTALPRRGVQHTLQALGRAGLRSQRPPNAHAASTAVDTTRAELLPLDKHWWRTGATLLQSRSTLDHAWDFAHQHLAPGPQLDPLRSRESAALLACARWTVAAALQRTETRGLHRRMDHLHSSATGADAIHVLRGVDAVQLHRQPRTIYRMAAPDIASFTPLRAKA